MRVFNYFNFGRYLLNLTYTNNTDVFSVLKDKQSQHGAEDAFVREKSVVEVSGGKKIDLRRDLKADKEGESRMLRSNEF